MKAQLLVLVSAALPYAIAAGILLAVLLTEAWRPAQPGTRGERCVVNFALFACAAFVELLIPFGLVSAALWARTHDLGLLNWLAVSSPFCVGIGVVALDAALYWQHRAMHAVSGFWRLHRVHHSDIGFDVSTALRFHPLETPVTLILMCGGILLIGPPQAAVVIFSTLKIAAALFEHANVRLPNRLDRVVRRVFVTPELHRMHHSASSAEANRNFATVFSVWDRLFGSYCPPRTRGLTLGLGEFRSPSDQQFAKLLLQPISGISWRQASRSPRRPDVSIEH
jgi:sterol desaturase/sphingolipid hydroxylase (fatty acid hydroxylase superfamily)